MNLLLGIQLSMRCIENRSIGKWIRTFLQNCPQSWAKGSWESFWEEAFLYIEKQKPEVLPVLRDWIHAQGGDSHGKELQSYQQGKRYGIECFAIGETGYPEALLQLSAPPHVVFFRGNSVRTVLSEPIRITVVGTRHPSAYGKALTQELVSALTRVQIPVISGFAHGIDRIAHEACCRAGGRSVGVLAQGADRCYPGANRDLVAPMLDAGGFLTTHPPGTEPRPRQFPARNRLLSALATVVVIPEAGVQSGSLITAGFAADQGIPVYVAPGNIYSPQSYGTNQLIEEGALLYRNVSAFMESLQQTLGVEKHPGQRARDQFLTHKRIEDRPDSALDNLESRILLELRAGTRTLSDWMLEAGDERAQWMLSLTRLELRGLISLDGDRYSVTDSGLRQSLVDSG